MIRIIDKFIQIEEEVVNLTKKHIDRLFYLGAIVNPIITGPQLLKIYMTQNVDGLSLWTSSGYMLGSLVMIIYGIVHKERPLVAVHITSFPIYIFIIVGIFLYR